MLCNYHATKPELSSGPARACSRGSGSLSAPCCSIRVVACLLEPSWIKWVQGQLQHSGSHATLSRALAGRLSRGLPDVADQVGVDCGPHVAERFQATLNMPIWQASGFTQAGTPALCTWLPAHLLNCSETHALTFSISARSGGCWASCSILAPACSTLVPSVVALSRKALTA